MTKFKTKSIEVTAEIWHKNGDMAHDNCSTNDNGSYTEGAVVRHFNSTDPKQASNKYCEHCDDTLYYHGWIDYVLGGLKVCPGDWVITSPGEISVCKDSEFQKTYEPVKNVTSVKLSELSEAWQDASNKHNNSPGGPIPTSIPPLPTPIPPLPTPIPPLHTPIPPLHTPIPPITMPRPLDPNGPGWTCEVCNLNFKGLTGYAGPKTNCPSRGGFSLGKFNYDDSEV